MNTCPYAPSLSPIKYLGAGSHGEASVICRASHSAVGCLVTSNQSRRRRPWPKTKTANNLSNVRDGTTHRSIAAMAFAWLRRNVFQLCEGGALPRTRYLDIVRRYDAGFSFCTKFKHLDGIFGNDRRDSWNAVDDR